MPITMHTTGSGPRLAVTSIEVSTGAAVDEPLILLSFNQSCFQYDPNTFASNESGKMA